MQDNINTPVVEAPEVPQSLPEVMKPYDALQQKKLEELIIKAKRDAARELRASRDRALKENETLRASLNLPQDTIDQLEATNLKLLAAKQEYAHFDGLNKAEKKRQALQAAATSVNFFDAGIGATL